MNLSQIQMSFLCLCVTCFVGCSSTKSFLGKASFSNLGKAKSEQQQFMFDVARANEKQGNLEAAETTYLKLIEQSPKDAKILHRLGVVYSRLETPEEASYYFREAIKLAPSDSELLTDYGYSLYLNGDLDKASTILRAAVKENNQNHRAINNLAIVVGLQGNTEESYSLFRQIVSEAEANANLAYVFAQRGDVESATQGYSYALSLNEDLDQASMALVQIAQQSSQPHPELRLASGQTDSSTQAVNSN
ncbi:MAG: tetratricopeptide repeat protein [Planctomycetaceae bacterium]|nr:tetratricopeptide repeat protein [Planctomycetaceae bacterium]